MKLFIRTVLTVLVTLALLSAGPAFAVETTTAPAESVETPQGAPAIQVDEREYNFGELYDEQTATHSFTVKNTGTAVLKINDVRVTCGCTVAHFDREIAPGGEGEVTLAVRLQGYEGSIKKAATILSNDPNYGQLQISVAGTVLTYIEQKPGRNVHFRGTPDKLQPVSIDFITNTEPFHVTQVETDLGEKIDYRVETVEEGKHYRLVVTNKAMEGNYRGLLTLHTDHPQKKELAVRVLGFIQGEMDVSPNTVFVGRLASDQPIINGKVMVVNNLGKAFEITRLTYDQELLEIEQKALDGRTRYELTIKPKLDGVAPSAAVKQLQIVIETSKESDSPHTVNVQMVNR